MLNDHAVPFSSHNPLSFFKHKFQGLAFRIFVLELSLKMKHSAKIDYLYYVIAFSPCKNKPLRPPIFLECTLIFLSGEGFTCIYLMSLHAHRVDGAVSYYQTLANNNVEHWKYTKNNRYYHTVLLKTRNFTILILLILSSISRKNAQISK